MDVDRRGFLVAAGLVAISPLVLAARRATSAASAAAPAFRPGPTSSSSLVCARCGSPEHDTLSGACPQDEAARAAAQADARRKTTGAEGGEIATAEAGEAAV